ncbi:uncharacterized protein LOC131440442 isoform X1 [Malaya genurostris]|uniref:uncharacterized protein LOC131440442 isoform X1 n=1 Tax=Malaya genurostris TaxID=325434 RepID=UPI0026F3C3C9|nr:uncharacterized protein LOC131440442 isoform X1 [Malaya genurostris]
MSSQIPPLFCHTPPPMDFDDDEEDVPEQEEDDFDDFAVAPTANVNTDLPTPIPSPFPGFATPSNSPVKKQLTHNQPEILPANAESVTGKASDDSDFEPPRIESPPSLILSHNIYSENDLPSEDDLPDYAFNQEAQKNVSNGASEADDNLSIPSLQLDTEVSKSVTPIHLSENDASEHNLSPREPTMEDLARDVIQEAVVTPVIAEDLCYRFDDNTENDFTDFTTASNERSVVLEVPTANDVSFDDDFAQLESTPSADSNFVSQSKTDFATFDADFSKFDSFPASFPATFDEIGGTSKDLSTKQPMSSDEKTSPDAHKENDLSLDDFDDFQDFAKFATDSNSAKTSKDDTETHKPCADLGESDDDFGEFSDFKQSDVIPKPAASIPTSRPTQITLEDILIVITGLFPSWSEETQTDTGQLTDNYLQNNLYNELKDIDTTKALAFQYNNSDSSKTLVRALGIDSRNILFGPKWNSSMPRFAANLGFSPLEPLKPASTTTIPRSTSSSNTATISTVETKSETGIKYPTFGSDQLPQSVGVTTGNVPAVQFDWNSSGLVNPLDASHAHTLLLDLEQLEVMANLKDKINIDSSSSSCNANTVQTLPSSSTTPTITTTTTTTTNQSTMVNNINTTNNTRNATNSNPDGGGSLLDDMNLFCTNPPTPLKPTNAFPVAACCPACFSTAVICTSSSQLTTTTTSTTTITSMHGDCDHATLVTPTCFESTNNLQSFDDYLDLSVQEILQESTGTYQPNKDESTSEVLDQKISKNSSASTANEVAPEISTASTIATAVLPSDYNEYVSSNQLESIPATIVHASVTSSPFVSSPVQASTSSLCSSPLATAANVVRTIKLPETHIFTPNKCVSPVSRDSTDRATDTYCEPPGDTQFETIPSKGIVVREYHDVEYSLDKNSRKKYEETEPPARNDELDDFHEFQSVGSVVVANNIKFEQTGDQRVPESRRTHLDVGSEFNFVDRKELTNNYSKPVFGTSPTEELDRMDDEFSDFQAAVPVTEGGRTVVNKPIANVANEQPRSNTSSPILLSPSILLPQQAKRNEPVEVNRGAQINWPEPGINSEELVRLEAAFSAPKVVVPANSSSSCSPKHAQNAVTTNAVDDEEWTDFVYSKPATNEKSSLKDTKPANSTLNNSNNQQEEWTDFIYSTPSTQNLSSSQNNFNYLNSFGTSKMTGPKFNAWNQPQLPPPQFTSWNSNNYYYNVHSNSASFAKSTVPTQKVPTFPAHTQAQHISVANNNHQQAPIGTNISSQLQRSGTSSVTGIQRLPELSFITPNTPAGGNASGVKTLTHSFLSNVISSNNFTKK